MDYTVDSFLESTEKRVPYFLLDVSWFAHRGFYAFSQFSVKIGGFNRPSGHVYGVLQPVMAIKQRYPRAVVVLCQDGRPVDRQNLDDSYKAQRPAKEYNVHQDIPDALEVATLFPGIFVANSPTLEADDLLFTLAARLSGEGRKAVIYSGDNDLLQAINQNVAVLRKWAPEGEKLDFLSFSFVREKYGTIPEKVPLFKAVTGDASDNIRGIPRFPRNLLKKMLEDCSSLEEMLQWGRPGLSKAEVKQVLRLRESYDLLKKNYRMVKLVCKDFPLWSREGANRANDPRIGLAEKWGLRSVLSRIPAVQAEGVEV